MARTHNVGKTRRQLMPIATGWSVLVTGLAIALWPASLPAKDPTVPVWTVVPAESRLGFVGTQSGAAFKGEFTDFSADIVFDPLRLTESKAMVTVRLDSALSFSRDRDELMRAPEWLDSGNRTTAVWEALQFTRMGRTRFIADGNLNLKGQIQPVQLEFDLVIEGDTAKLTGEASLDRTTWKVGTGNWSTEDVVGHEVKVTVDLTAKRTRG